MEELPLVSIVITSYNRANLIGDAIISALQQDYKNFEIIISDNCSNDNTENVIKDFLPDGRIKYFRNDTNIGMIANFQKAIESLAKGKYFLNLCSDDILSYKGFIREGVAIIHKYPNVMFVKGKSHCVDLITGKVFSDKNSNLFESEFRIGTEVFRQYSGKDSLGWDGALIDREKQMSLNIFKDNHNGFDLGSNLKLSLLGNVGFIDKYCYVFRMHSTNESNNAVKESGAKHVLSNFKIIDDSYDFAFKYSIFNKNELDEWKSAFVRNWAVNVAKDIYKHDKTEFKIFLSEIKRRYGLTFSDLNRGIKSKLVYVFFYFPIVGNFLRKVKHMTLRKLSE